MDRQTIRQSPHLNTHPNFKSADERVKDVNTLNKLLFDALRYQHEYDLRMTTPGEIDIWDKDELQKLKIDLENIDRLYHIFSDTNYDKYCHMICRMHYKGHLLYLEFFAFHQEFHPVYRTESRSGGIFVSRDAFLFMYLIQTSFFRSQMYPINKLLEKDDIQINDQYPYNDDIWRFSPVKNKQVQTLQYICHEFICRKKK